MTGKWEYMVVYDCGSTLTDLESKVNDRLNDGWNTAGPLVVIGTLDGVEYYQPMIRFTRTYSAAAFQYVKAAEVVG